jgi:hypothetical protein
MAIGKAAEKQAEGGKELRENFVLVRRVCEQ